MLSGEIKAVGSSSGNGNGSNSQINLPNSITFNDSTGTIKIKEVYDGASESFAIDTNGDVWAWGYNGYGQLGLGDTTNRLTANKITYFSNRGIKIAKVIINDCSVNTSSVAGRTTFFITTSGLLYGTGNNGNSRLGNGTSADVSIPNLISGVSKVVNMSCTSAGSCYAITEDNSLYVWGWNGYGQLGTGDATTRAVPVLAMRDVAQSSFAFSQDVSNSAGYSYALILKTDGTIWASGFNNHGQLGTGDTTNITSFVKVEFPTGEILCKSINCQDGAYGVSTAIDVDNNLWLWGYNGYGQLGNGTSTSLSVPFKPTSAFQGSASSVKIAGYKTGTTVLVYSKSLNSIWVSGYNGNGLLGKGTTDSSANSTFISLAGINGAIEDYEVRVNDGGNTSGYILLTDGRVLAWGYNDLGQLGTRPSTGNQTSLAEVLF
jgi:alpha-tubulin suppressor-like RCC1 family protein